MLTLATIKVEGPKPNDYEINVDVDDNGWAYLKQGEDWVCFPAKLTDRVIAALQNICRE